MDTSPPLTRASEENDPAQDATQSASKRTAGEQEQLLKLKKKLHVWERDFKVQNGRKPGKADIDASQDIGMNFNFKKLL
jgi:hypothetical protein